MPTTSLTMTNIMADTARNTIGRKSLVVQEAGQSLSTGQKKMSAVESYVSGLLRGESNLLKTIVQNTNNASNIFSTAQKALGEMTKSLEDMLSIIAQARGNSAENTKTLNTALGFAVNEISRIIDSTDFGGRKLLRGDLSADPTISSDFSTKAVGIQRLSSAGNLAARGTAGVNTLTVGVVTAGEVLRVGDRDFTAVSGKPQNEGEFTIGSTAAETARNIATALVNSSSEELKKYTINLPTDTTVTLTQIASTDKNLRIQGSTHITNAVTAAGTKGGIDLSGIKDIAGFIGSPITNIRVLSQVVSVGTEAKGLASQFNNAAAIAAVSAGGDEAATYEMNIGGKVFTGALFRANAGNLHGAELKMTHASTEESFTLTFGAAYAGILTTEDDAKDVATAIKEFFEESRFTQTRQLEINTEQGDIVNNGNLIGSTEGLVATLTSTDFDSKKFTGVEIKQVTGTGVKISVFVEGPSGAKQNFTYTAPTADITNLVQGYKLDLTDALTGDVLSLNLGKEGLTALANVENYKPIEEALNAALQKTGSGLEVRVGSGFDNVLNMRVGNMSLTKLFRDDDNNIVTNLSVLDDKEARVAQKVIENALKMVRSEMSSVQTQLENLQNISASLEATIQITSDAAKSYSEVDLVEAAKNFSEGIKSITAAISGYQAGNKIADAAERLLQGL